MLERIHDLRRGKQTFAFETTLATRSYVPFLRDAQTAGYLVHVIYIWLSSVALARSRVAARVQQGGHDVPTEVIERRYWRGLRNFFHLYQPLADTWMLCNNSEDRPIRVARGSRGALQRIYESDLFERIRADAGCRPN